MSSNSGQIPTPSKAVNIPNQSVSTTYYSTSSFDNGSQRRAGGSGSFGAGLTSRTTSAPRNNQTRKSQHKRQRRPRLDDEEYTEAAIMRSTNSRKGQTSITHLMNFSIPRPQHHPPQRNTRRYASWGLGSGHHAMDKARYVHANYRFIVTPNRGYHAQAANADVHLDWDSVLQVLVSAQTQSASCPICLSTPVAPRMARCGHIFCLPCIIRYMHSTDEENLVPEKKARWKKCPICWDTIYITETRPVRWFRGQESDLPFEGGDVVLRLVKREPKSTLALPRDGAQSIGPDEDVPWYHVAEVADYARIMKGSEDYMVCQYDNEIEDLRRQEAEDEVLFGDETTWTQKAIAAICDAKTKVQGIGNPPEIPQKIAPGGLPREPIPVQPLPDEVATMHTSRHNLKSGKIVPTEPLQSGAGPSTSGTQSDVDCATGTLERVHIDPTHRTKAKRRDPGTARASILYDRTRETNGPHPPDCPFYFYQALPHFYLSPLDIRILKAAFGDYSLFPATILPRVEHISTGHIVDDELRKRVKYLGHLPQGCEVSFLECDWRDVVGPDILERFAAETERRRKRNREKEAREEKDRVRAEKEDEKHWAAVRRNRRSSVSAIDPPFFDHDFEPLASGSSGSGPSNHHSSTSPPQSSHPGASISPSNSPLGARTVWGTAAIPTLAQEAHLHSGATSYDGWLDGWEEELLAQQEHELLAQTAASENNPPPPSGGKKKKNKKITLMSTNIQRGA